ncbi:MAG: hypothetical protein AAFX06_01670 [Planctomycetota bacterium]
MKSIYTLFAIACLIATLGCDGKENSLADENLTADDFAKYEAELAAANGEASYEEETK